MTLTSVNQHLNSTVTTWTRHLFQHNLRLSLHTRGTAWVIHHQCLCRRGTAWVIHYQRLCLISEWSITSVCVGLVSDLSPVSVSDLVKLVCEMYPTSRWFWLHWSLFLWCQPLLSASEWIIFALCHIQCKYLPASTMLQDRLNNLLIQHIHWESTDALNPSAIANNIVSALDSYKFILDFLMHPNNCLIYMYVFIWH